MPECSRRDRRDWNTNIGRNQDDTVICEPGELAKIQTGKCRIACGELWAGYYVCVKA